MQDAAFIKARKSAVSFPLPDLGLFAKIFAILVWAVAYLPSIEGAFSNIITFSKLNLPGLYEGPWLKALIKNKLGEQGLVILAPLSAALMAIGVYRLICSFGVKNWAAGLGSIFAILLPVFGFSPGYIYAPDEAIFAALTLFSFAELIKAKLTPNTPSLAFAFLFACIACWFRPFAAWPIFAVFTLSVVPNPNYDGRPYYGTISALSWGPGLFLAHFISGIINETNSDITSIKSYFVFNFNSQIISWAQNSGVLGLICLLFLASIIALVFLKKRKMALIIAAISLITIIGSVFYGSIVAARYLFENLALAFVLVTLSFALEKPQVKK